MKNIDEMDTALAINNDLTERCFKLLAEGIVNDDLSGFYSCFSKDVIYNNFKGKEEVINELNRILRTIKDKDLICTNVITALRILKDKDGPIFGIGIDEFYNGELYDIYYKNKKLFLITDNNEKITRTALSIDFNSSGDINKIESILINDDCEYKVIV